MRLLKTLVASSILLVHGSALLNAAKWDDIDPADFALKQSSIDPEANVEILLSEVEVAQYFIDWNLKSTYRIHIRMKVFDEVGVGELTRAEFPYYDGQRITKIEARTVKPDGSSIELDSKTVYETEIVKSSQGKVKAKAFAFPALEPGDIVEARFELKSTNQWDVHHSFGSEYPARRAVFRIKPAEPTEYFTHQMVWFNFPEADGKSNRGYFTFERLNQPASSDEDYRIPDLHTEPYVVLYYNFETPPSQGRYWKDTARQLHADTNKSFKGSKKVAEKADELIAGAATDAEKLRRLYDFCITEIVNQQYNFGAFTDGELDEMKENGNPTQTLERARGEPSDIRHLFGALALAAGFDARLVAAPDRRDIVFTKNLTYRFALGDRLVGVQLDGEWQYFNPGNPNLPCGTIDWWNAGSEVLIADKRKELFTASPLLDASKSSVLRTGKLSIDEAGKLSGKVTQAYSGYEAVDLRMDLESKSTKEAEEMIRNRVARDLPQAALRNIAFENTRDVYKPMIVTYDLEVPGYAEVVGDRIFVQPAVFQKGREAAFQQEGERESSIMFSYPWREEDEIMITLPDGYAMDAGQAPEPFDIDGVLSYEATVGLGKDRPLVKLTRAFTMEHSLLAPKAAELFKRVFANLKIQDSYALTYKRAEEAHASR